MIKYLVRHIGFWFGAVFFAAGLFFLIMILQSYFLDKNFSEDGQITNGKVVGKRVDIEIDENHTYEYPVLSYEFNLQNLPTQSGESSVSETKYTSVKIGDNIKVEYLASDPTTHRLLGSSSGTVAIGFIVPFSLIFVLIGLGLLLSAFRRAMRQSRLWKKGIAIKGRVTRFICNNPDAIEDKTYHLTYEYEGPDGETITGKSQSHSRNWFLRTAEGDIIDIVADPKNPSKSEWRKEME